MGFWILFFSGLLVFVCSMFAVLLIARLHLSGAKARGRIVGYASEIRRSFNIINTYKVEYDYMGKTYTAVSVEPKTTLDLSITGGKPAPPPDLREVTVRFDPKRPQSVSIVEFAFRNTLVCVAGVLIGVAGIVLSLKKKGIL